jgi:hypothetical protein
MEARGERDQLLEIIEPACGVLGLALAKHPAIAAGVQEQGELIGERDGGILADATDLVGQGQSLVSGFRRKGCGFESGEKRDVAERRLLDDREGLRAEVAPRLVDDAPEGLVVADGEDAPAEARHGLEPIVLGVVDVLVLVGNAPQPQPRSQCAAS